LYIRDDSCLGQGGVYMREIACFTSTHPPAAEFGQAPTLHENTCSGPSDVRLHGYGHIATRDWTWW